jgi:hypothetical protein
MKNSS